MKKPQFNKPKVLDRYAKKIRDALIEIDRISNDEKRADHPDYNLELIRGWLLLAWSPSPQVGKR
jgi:hypothetical protein